MGWPPWFETRSFAALLTMRPIRRRPLGSTRFESLPDLLLRQIAPDEDDPAVARLAVFPWALMVAVEDHVHALEHEARRVVLEIQDALAAQDAWSVFGHQVLDPRKEL